MSEQHPPTGDSSYSGKPAFGSIPDYGRNDVPVPSPDAVSLGGGAWNDPKDERPSRKWWYVGGGAVAAIAVVAGGTVFAATQLRAGHDAGSAAAMPSDTLLFAGVDLNPNAGQKIEAIKALRKFPAFTQGVKLDPSADLRKLMLEDELTSDGCSLDWEKNISPWLGNDVGAGLVPGAGDARPEPVVVLAVTDETAAKKDLPKLLDCARLPHGLSVANGWAVVASSDSVAKSVAADAEGGSLADDSDFKTWVDRTGDPGVMTFYGSKDAGSTLSQYADQAISLFDSFDSSSSSSSGSGSSDPDADWSMGWDDDGNVFDGSASDDAQFAHAEVAPAAYTSQLLRSDDGVAIDPTDPSDPSDPSDSSDPLSLLFDMCPGALSGSGEQDAPNTSEQDQLKSELASLQGGAATLRFANGGFELESASSVEGAKASGGSAGLTSLPSDTAIAFGSASGAEGIDTFLAAFSRGFAQGLSQGLGQDCGTSPDAVLSDLGKLTGLTLPADLETLFGKGVTFAASGSIDPEVLSNSTTPSDLAAGLKLQGDPEQLTAILKKITFPGAEQVLGTTSGDGVVAVGPDADYRAELVKDGSLGNSDAFTDVLPHADKASSAFFVSFENMRKLLSSSALGIPADVRDNLEHLQAFGASSWVDGGITHGLVRLSTR